MKVRCVGLVVWIVEMLIFVLVSVLIRSVFVLLLYIISSCGCLFSMVILCVIFILLLFVCCCWLCVWIFWVGIMCFVLLDILIDGLSVMVSMVMFFFF